MAELKEEEEKQKEYKKQKRKRKLEDEEETVGDPDMMAMMGFSGFGTSSKKH